MVPSDQAMWMALCAPRPRARVGLRLRGHVRALRGSVGQAAAAGIVGAQGERARGDLHHVRGGLQHATGGGVPSMLFRTKSPTGVSWTSRVEVPAPQADRQNSAAGRRTRAHATVGPWGPREGEAMVAQRDGFDRSYTRSPPGIVPIRASPRARWEAPPTNRSDTPRRVDPRPRARVEHLRIFPDEVDEPVVVVHRAPGSSTSSWWYDPSSTKSRRTFTVFFLLTSVLHEIASPRGGKRGRSGSSGRPR